MKSIKVNDLPELILERSGFTYFGDLYLLLHQDQIQGSKVFKNILIQTLKEFAKLFPVNMSLTLQTVVNRQYTFVDTMEAYMTNILAEDQIQLRPKGVRFVQSMKYLSADYWKYDKNNFTIYFLWQPSRVYMSYFADYPYKLELGNDGKFTEDSVIYYLDMFDDTNFITYLQFYIVKYLKQLITSMDTSANSIFLKNLPELYSELENKINEINECRSNILEMWRK